MVFFDALRVKIRDEGLVRNKAVYLALAITCQGEKEVLGLWIEQTEGAKFWLKVMNELKTRGVGDILIAVVDGLTGFPDAIAAVFPRTAVQTCIVHLIRNSLAFVAWKDRKTVMPDLRAIYRADTTEFSWRRKRLEAVGFTTTVNSGRDKAGRDRLHTVCGLLMHSSLAVTTDGLPLGMVAVRFWSRKKFKGTAALKRKVNPTRVPIEGKESMRWLANLRQSTELLGEAARCVHIADREDDIWELFCLARELDTHFLVRRCVDRLAGDGSHMLLSTSVPRRSAR